MVVPLKNKTGPTLDEAFKVILTSGRKPEKIMTDQGTEFLNKHFRALMKEEDVELYNTYNETKASIVERLIRTLKTKMWRYFTAKKTMRYVDMLPDLVYSYNHSVHRSIKTKPVDVTAENEKKVWHTLYDDHNVVKNVKYKFKIGDQVRISKMKRTFEKGYLPNFSKEIFTISKQIPRDPPVYKLKDLDGEELKGTFYEKELQKIIKEDDVYEIEKILKKRGRGNNVHYLVKWLGYPNKFNSWVPASERFKPLNVLFVCYSHRGFIMSGTHFYLTLPSNASLDVFPDNKTTEYRVKLPQPIELDGNWEVGLYSIFYTNTWCTLRNINVDTHFYYVEGTGWPSVATMKYEHYETMQDFVKNMNASLESEIGNSTSIYLTYSTRTGKVTVHLKPKCKLVLYGKMSLILGFGGKEVTVDAKDGLTKESPYVTDLATFTSIYTYCNIIQPQIVGDTSAQLLRSIPVEGKYGDIVTKTFTNIQYVPVQTKSFGDVKIRLRNDMGDPVPFERGKLITTLHYRQHTYFT